jgi:hypothetical protein
MDHFPLWSETSTEVQASLQVLTCFWQAYQHCQAATLDLKHQGMMRAALSGTRWSQAGKGVWSM